MRTVSGPRLFVIALLFVISIGLCGQTFGQAAVQGKWTTLPNQMPINPVHATLMRNGKILIVSGSGNDPAQLAANNLKAAVFDPASGTTVVQSISWDMFCNGMVVLPDGRPFINGGTLQYDPFYGSPKSSVFDPTSNTFTDVQNMTYGRWYPTPTVLGDGRVMTFSGLDVTGSTTNTVEIYTSGVGWSTPVGASWTPPLYPRMHLLPSGKVFYSGSTTTSRLFDPSSGTWSTVATTKYSGTRTYGTSVLLGLTPANNYAPKVMILGGGNPSTATTELIDLSAPTPAWAFGPSMSQPRIEMSAVILPNGKVLAMGGSYNDEDLGTASLNADLYDPATNTMSSAGANAFARLYHSVAILLPDATVWLAGGNPTRGSYEPRMEIYQPSYLFTTDLSGNSVPATRPTIGAAPANVGYGTTFSVDTPDAASISQVVLVRPGSPTHAFDQEQRLVGMSYTTGAGTLTVTAPPNGNIAPPGYYMLFLLNSSGVPSVASFVRLGQPAAPDFNLGISPISQTVVQGSGTTFNVSVAASGGFSGTVTFAATGLPSGANAAFNPASVSGSGSTVMNVSTSASTPLGSYPLTITATSGALVHTIPATLVVSLPTAAAPSFSPPPGTYPTAQAVTLTAAPGATIYYTVDGSTPTTASTIYTAPIPVTTAATINAIAALSGFNNSPVATGTYVISTGAPSVNFSTGFTSLGMAFNGSAALMGTRLRLTDGGPSEAGSAFYTTQVNVQTFTNDFSFQLIDPNADGFVFVIQRAGTTALGPPGGYLGYGGITPSIGNSVAIKFDLYGNSGESTDSTGLYTNGAAPMSPSITLGGGVDLQSGDVFNVHMIYDGTTLTMTITDAATPTNTFTTSWPINIASVIGGTNAYVGFTGGTGGLTAIQDILNWTYTSAVQATVATPTFNPAPGNYTAAQSVTISDATAGSTIYYTIDGSAPTTSSSIYTAPIAVAATTTIKAMATATGLSNSAVASGVYNIGAAPPPAITFVQAGTGPGSIQSSNISVAVAYPGAQVAGNLNVVVIGWGDIVSTISSVTDTRGNTYALAIGPTSTTDMRQSIYYAKNIAGGSNTVTVRFNQAAAYPDVRILEYTGADAVNPLDAKVGASGSGTAANSGSATTTSANELIFGAGTTGNIFTGAGSGFASRMINLYGNIAEDKAVSAVGSYNATASALSAPWIMQMATFRAAGQGAAPPAISSVSPTTGTSAGGTGITISGTGFVAGAAVTIGGTAATNVVVVGATSITATTPPHAAGAVNVVVTNPDTQTGTLTNGFTYTNPAPTVAAISPGSGPAAGGTTVTITGTGFLNGASVTVGGTAATNVVVVSGTSITATTPAHAAGSASVVVTNNDTQFGTLSNGYTFNPNPAPTVTGIAPTSGTTAGGTSVTITGTGFLNGASVTIGGTAATNVLVSGGTSITATTPAHGAGAADIVVSNTDGQFATLTGGYTFTVPNPAPTVGNVSPNAGGTAGGTAVTITGTGFLNGATVSVGGAAASNVVVVGGTSITATTPAHAAGPVSVVVTNTDGQSGTLANGYTYTSPNPAPTVGSVTPSSGTTAGGTSLAIAGTGFLNGATVVIGGTPATGVVVVSGTSITAVTASHTAGVVNVVVTNTDGQSGTSVGGFTYTSPAPVVSTISPTSGTTAGGTPVTITGTGFLAGATVTFSGTAATNVVVSSGTTITATTPARTAGTANVTVTNTDGQSSALTNGFTYSNPTPTVTAISPTSGPTAGGTAVTITGTGFLAGASVAFSGTAATNVVVVSGTSITATTPARATGAATVTVTNTDGKSGSLTNGYTYSNPTPTITSVSPTSGTASGGTAVTITGTGFLSGATVTFGGTAATNVVVVSGTSITATTPAHAAGAVNVVVTNTDGKSATRTNGYTYQSATSGITFVQAGTAPNSIQTPNTSVVVPFPTAQVAGHLNIVVIGWGDTTSTIASVTDTLGNTYSLAVGPTANVLVQQAIYYAKNIAGGANSVTVRFNQPAAYPDVRIVEYAGADTANPLDAKATATGSSATANSGNVTTTSANELIFASGTTANIFFNAGTGFTSRMINIYGNIVEDRFVTATGTYNATATTSSSTPWVMQVATFK